MSAFLYFLLVAMTPAISALLLRSVVLHGPEAARQDRYTPFLVIASLGIDIAVLFSDFSTLKAFLLFEASLLTLVLLLGAVAGTIERKAKPENQ